jgi:hypothetical protein
MAQGDLSPRHLRELHAGLVSFVIAYGRYLEVTHGVQPDDDEAGRLRAEMNSLTPTAQEALRTARIELVIHPPPVVGGPSYSGLANVAFLFERPGWGGAGIPRRVLDMGGIGIAQLEKQIAEATRRRRNPLYWTDRGLRAVLGFPAYLLSLVLGVPVARIEESPWAILIRVAEIALAAIGAYFGGREAGWW